MPEQQARVFIIVPCFNEHQVIRKTLSELSETPYEIVLIDDGSSPSIEPLIQDFSIHFIRHPQNLGQGASLRTGMRHALEQGAEILVTFDADGQHQVSDIKELILPILEEKCEVVLGSRFLRAEDRRVIPPGRRRVLRIARIFNGFYTGLWLSDAHNGFRAFSRGAAQIIQINKDRMAHPTEILWAVKRKGLSYCEVATHIVYPTYAWKKGLRWWDTVGILRELFVR